jgi:hypothetical protein
MPDTFEIADVLVALGGDILNSVPRYDVTAAEIAVLQVIHGNDAVKDIRPKGTIERPQRVERERLKNIYGGARANDGRPHVEILYPGAAARVFDKLDELTLDDSQFAAERVSRSGGQRMAEAAADRDAGVALAAASMANAPKGEDDIDELPGDNDADSGVLG